MSKLTLDAIRTSLTELKTRLNIVLVHHHPKKHPWIEDGNSVMQGGDKLLELLKDTERQWLVIHGHQHVPYLTYADTSAFSPIILSSASVAAKTYPVQGEYARNQIHLVSIPLEQIDQNGERIVGEVRSWTWAMEAGWSISRDVKSLPARAGFGHRPDITELRNTIVELITARAGPIKWAELKEHDNKIHYMTPDDQLGLIKLLQKRNVYLSSDDNGQPDTLGLRS